MHRRIARSGSCRGKVFSRSVGRLPVRKGFTASPLILLSHLMVVWLISQALPRQRCRPSFSAEKVDRLSLHPAEKGNALLVNFGLRPAGLQKRGPARHGAHRACGARRLRAGSSSTRSNPCPSPFQRYPPTTSPQHPKNINILSPPIRDTSECPTPIHYLRDSRLSRRSAILVT